jgi:hypothetical protein
LVTFLTAFFLATLVFVSLMSSFLLATRASTSSREKTIGAFLELSAFSV